MNPKDLRYIAAYLIPLLTLIALFLKGYYAYLTPVIVFGILPIIESWTPNTTTNLSESEILSAKELKFFDWLLYLNVPIIYGLIAFFIYVCMSQALSTFELIGLIFSLGIAMGANGINVAHELGHRHEPIHKFLSKSLLLPSMYMHFIIEHNLGHHKNVGTDKDPASAKKSENIYFFWIRSVVGSFISAWKIESKRLKSYTGIQAILHNQMIGFLVLESMFIGFIFWISGPLICAYFLVASIISFLLLETINYVEHYGLRRKLINGRYERVTPKHSWNSNHELGRILLYELTRHSDHHFMSNKKYQLLEHKEESKQLPLGYPASMVISLIPPLWFKLMNHRI